MSSSATIEAPHLRSEVNRLHSSEKRATVSSQTPKAAVVVGWAVLIGFLVRMTFVGASNFPLYDGGLFYSMVRDLERAHFALPAQTSYNSAGLPYAYPPLAFYVAGFLNSVVGWSLLGIFRFMPLLMNTLAIAAFGMLARSMLSDFAAFTAAVLTFSLLPEGFRFFITGGGLTRSMGLLFAVLGLWAAYGLCMHQRWRYVPWLMVTIAGAVLSHPEMALFSVYSIFLLVVFYGRDRTTVSRVLVSGTGAAIFIAPWLLSVVTREGIAPFIDAMARGGNGVIDIGSILTFNITGETSFPFLGFLAVVGLVVCLANRRFLLPIWLLVIFLLQSRDPRQEDIVPIALLAGIGAAEGVLPLVRNVFVGHSLGEVGHKKRLGTVILVFMFASVALSDTIWYRPLLTGLSAGEQIAMAWVHGNTAKDSRFLIITGTAGGDRSFEWFPALTGRINAAPIEGYEWAPGFQQRVKDDAKLQECAVQNAGCVRNWSWQTGVTYEYIYLPKRPKAPLFAPSVNPLQTDCCLALRAALQASPRYDVVYDGPGATIYRLKRP